MTNKNKSSELVTRGDLAIEFRLHTQELKESFKSYIDSILTKIDPILKEVMDAREEREIMNGRINNHDKRISKLERAGQVT